MTNTAAPRSWPDRVRLPLAFDAVPLAAELGRFDQDDWVAHFVHQHYQGDWSALPLRAAAGETHPIRMIHSDPGADRFVDTPLLARVPRIAAVLAALRCPLQSVRLMRLTPGSLIKPHRDHDLAAETGTARLHLPITTNPQVEFLLGGTPVPMRPGEAWYLRLSDTHAVANRGASDRVHLVIDAVVDAWLAAQLDAGAGRVPQPDLAAALPA
jgi:hypothetical protein